MKLSLMRSMMLFGPLGQRVRVGVTDEMFKLTDRFKSNKSLNKLLKSFCSSMKSTYRHYRILSVLFLAFNASRICDTRAGISICSVKSIAWFFIKGLSNGLG